MPDYSFNDFIDGHAHIIKVADASEFPKKLTSVRSIQAGIACQDEDSVTNNNPAGFVLKSRDPGRFYVLAGLEHSSQLYEAEDGIPLGVQVGILQEIGVDGIKILASKPSERKRLGQALDGEYFSGLFSECERLGLPILWHVADPEEFWMPEKLPLWAQEQGWGYDSSYPSKEELYQETENVLRRHPSLKVVFPHFYFLSGDLDRADRFLSSYPNVCFDLTPGIELYYTLSRDVKKAKEFVSEYSDRILFGTDILSSHTVREIQARVSIVYRFLTEEGEFQIPPGTDSLLGQPEDGVIRGLKLPGGIVNSITIQNFRRIYGQLPSILNVSSAREECLRLGRIESQVQKLPVEETEGYAAAVKLSKITIAGN